MLIFVLILAAALVLLRSGPSIRPGALDNVVLRIGAAIAKAEGFFAAGTLPWRLNNPGSIVDAVTGRLIQYATVEQGWTALYHQITLMLTGQSAYYRPFMSIRQVAVIYTGGDNWEAWANIVSGELGVSPDTPIGALV